MPSSLDIGRFVAGKFRDYVRDGNTSMSVNLPGLALPQPADTHRLMLVHRNVPGVLATVNAIFGEHKANVEAQLLGTRGEVGAEVDSLLNAFVHQKLLNVNDDRSEWQRPASTSRCDTHEPYWRRRRKPPRKRSHRQSYRHRIR